AAPGQPAATGESYTTALRHFRAAPPGESMPETNPVCRCASHGPRRSPRRRGAARQRAADTPLDARRAPGGRSTRALPRRRDELAATVALAGELRLWTVLGSIHRLTPPHRPHNSLYVISNRGESRHSL